MMTSLKGAHALILCAILVLLGCAKDPVEGGIRTNNPGVPVDLLFEQDGCKVYRFEDAGHHRYFVVCPTSSASAAGITWEFTRCQQNGKTRTCHTHGDVIQTVARRE